MTRRQTTSSHTLESPHFTARQPGQEAIARSDRTARRGCLWPVWIALLFWMLVAAAAGAALMAATDLYRSDRILYGVRARGIDLGGRTVTRAAAMLRDDWQSQRIVLDAGLKTWSLPPRELGILLDAEATIQAAYRQGRSLPTDPGQVSEFLRRIVATFDHRLASTDQVEVPPVWTFDRNAAAAMLRTLAQQVEIEPQDAAVRIMDGQIEALPSVTGRAMDTGAALAALEAQAEPLATGARTLRASAKDTPVRLPLKIVPLAPTIADVSSVVQEASALLAKPLVLHLWDPVVDERLSWTIPPETMSGWLAFQASQDDPGKVEWTVDETRVAATLREQQAGLGAERYLDPQEAVSAVTDAFKAQRSDAKLRIYHYDRTHTVKSGETLSSIAFDYGIPYPWIQTVNPDLGDALQVGQAIRIPSQDALLPLPPVEGKRIKVSIGQQKMWVYENGELKWEWPVSTGMASSPTNPGIFQIQTHDPMAYAARWDLWMPNFMGIYQPVPSQDFMNGFHGFPSRDQRQILWTRNLGHPVTYGCILISTDNSKLLYDWAEEGVIVEVEK